MVQGSSTVDRLDGVNEGIAVKAPCRIGTTANITLSGLQTIDGVLTVADDRVLVKNQTDAIENGIYDASSGTWTRSLDANGNRDLVEGTRVVVTNGTTLIRTTWEITSDNPIVIDTDEIAFTQIAGSGTVTSAALTMPTAVFDVSGSPITSAGTFVVTFDTQTANKVFAGPSTGAAAEPTFRTLVTADLPSNPTISTILFVIDGGGSAITTGIKGDVTVHFGCTINEVVLLADQSGSIVVDCWADSYSNYPPTDADSITASAVPTITAATKARDTTLTGWTTAIAAGTTIRFNVDSCTTITRATIAFKVVKT